MELQIVISNAFLDGFVTAAVIFIVVEVACWLMKRRAKQNRITR